MENILIIIGGLIIGFVVLMAINGMGYFMGGFLPKKLKNSRYRILIPLLILSISGHLIYFIFFN